jgi:hypothetical protein
MVDLGLAQLVDIDHLLALGEDFTPEETTHAVRAALKVEDLFVEEPVGDWDSMTPTELRIVTEFRTAARAAEESQVEAFVVAYDRIRKLAETTPESVMFHCAHWALFQHAG